MFRILATLKDVLYFAQKNLRKKKAVGGVERDCSPPDFFRKLAFYQLTMTVKRKK